MMKFLSRIFRKVPANSYLASHGYYNCLDRKERAKSYGKYPDLPYSLTDFLKSRSIQGKQILILKSGSTARWFSGKGKNTVVLGREHRSKNGSPSRTIQYLSDLSLYDGAPWDILVVDTQIHAKTWEHLKQFRKEESVLIVVKPNGQGHDRGYTMESDLYQARTKNIEFRNPAPGVEELVALLYYGSENFLGI